MSADLSVLQALFGTWVSECSRQVLLLVGGVVLLTITHPRLTLTTLLVTLLVVAVALGFGRRLRRATTGLQDQVAEAMGTAEEAFGQIRTVQAFTREIEGTLRETRRLDDDEVALDLAGRDDELPRGIHERVDLGAHPELAGEVDPRLDREADARDQQARLAGLEIVDVGP